MNINIQERFNHLNNLKKRIIKGFAMRARILCDEDKF